jgi:hypothetical protein
VSAVVSTRAVSTMLYAVKRLALGVFLIALTSAILLLADRGHR